MGNSLILLAREANLLRSKLGWDRSSEGGTQVCTYIHLLQRPRCEYRALHTLIGVIQMSLGEEATLQISSSYGLSLPSLSLSLNLSVFVEAFPFVE